MKTILVLILMLVLAVPALAAKEKIEAPITIEFRLSCAELSDKCSESLDLHTGEVVFVEKKAAVSMKDIDKASLGELSESELTKNQSLGKIELKMTRRGKRKLLKATKKNVGRKFAVVLNNRIIYAPLITEPVDKGSISFIVTPKENAALVVDSINNWISKN